MAQQPNNNVRISGPGRDDDKKVFVGGIGRAITENELLEYFLQYGDVENLIIKTNKVTGVSRGFAFVQFVNAKTVDELLAADNHIIRNKKVDPKRVTKKVNPLCCQIFVGGLTNEMTEHDIRNYFDQFGKIVEYQQPFNKIKNQKRKYSFITFEDSEVVNHVLKNPKPVINGKELIVQNVKFNPEPMTANRARTGPMSVARASGTFGVRPAYPDYMALAAASPYGTPAHYGYEFNAYDVYCAYAGNDYSAIDYGGSGYRAQLYRGGRYRGARNPRHASS